MSGKQKDRDRFRIISVNSMEFHFEEMVGFMAFGALIIIWALASIPALVILAFYKMKKLLTIKGRQ